MKNVELGNWILLVNLCVFGAFILQYFWGAPSPAILIAAAVFFVVVNAIFFALPRSPKKAH